MQVQVCSPYEASPSVWIDLTFFSSVLSKGMLSWAGALSFDLQEFQQA